MGSKNFSDSYEDERSQNDYSDQLYNDENYNSSDNLSSSSGSRRRQTKDIRSNRSTIASGKSRFTYRRGSDSYDRDTQSRQYNESQRSTMQSSTRSTMQNSTRSTMQSSMRSTERSTYRQDNDYTYRSTNNSYRSTATMDNYDYGTSRGTNYTYRETSDSYRTTNYNDTASNRFDNDRSYNSSMDQSGLYGDMIEGGGSNVLRRNADVRSALSSDPLFVNFNKKNLGFIFNLKVIFRGNESEYNFISAIKSSKFINIKSASVLPESSALKTASKTACKIKQIKSFFEKRQKNHKLILTEHQALSGYKRRIPSTIGSHPLNEFRNRFAQSVPYDFNRVRLCDSICETDSDYINASYIHSYDRSCAFITTQNPLEHTVKDFWIMVYENKSRAIFSLVDYNNKKVPMERYWPPEGTVLEYNEFEIHSLKKTNIGKIIIRDLEIVPGNGLPPLRVRHYNYIEWSDMRAPPIMQECSLLVRNAIESVSDELAGPVVVHCGSGTGRSFVFLALILVQMQIDNLGVFDIFRTCVYLKEQRNLVFKDLPQYLFINIYAAKTVSLKENPNNESLYSL